jgi:uncharacterized SAM-binding protein YcdF (DUF218 family)
MGFPNVATGAREEQVIVVLGCAIRVRDGALAGVAGARAREAAREYARMTRAQSAGAASAGVDGVDAGIVVVTSGGRKWDGIVEADALRDALARDGVPAAAVLRERCSFSTRENAEYVARLLGRRGIDDVTLVTSAWHMARAAALFRAQGLRVREVPAEDARVEGLVRRVALRGWWSLRERVSAWRDGVA